MENGKLVLLICFIFSISLIVIIKIKNGESTFRRKYVFEIGYVFALTTVSYFLYVAIYYSILFNSSTKGFNRDAWVNNVEKRYELVDDLFKQKMLDKKNMKSIENLLGKPTFSTDSVYYYYMGFRPSLFAIDPEFLFIRFKKTVVRTYYKKPVQ